MSVTALGICWKAIVQSLTVRLEEEGLVRDLVEVDRTETAVAVHRNHPAVAGVAVGIHLLGVAVVVAEERLHRMDYHHLRLLVLLLTLMRDPLLFMIVDRNILVCVEGVGRCLINDGI